ncbi:MAG TPA: carbamoyltransferase HypF [Kiritimatiellae bacterium]|nr:carbamoyltransferase HypF [Kiritimatiellia bacterium]
MNGKPIDGTLIPSTRKHPTDLQRWRICIRGVVQGLGFRPFIYRLATGIGLAGWVQNTPEGVTIEVQGTRASLETFLLSVESHPPPLSQLQSITVSERNPEKDSTFTIRRSRDDSQPRALVLPDIATCSECLKELFDPTNRRYRYPFINCTFCGPRFSIIRRLPYDRPNTTMHKFLMCDQCRTEYEDPTDRRFHAQPNACPRCGPRLELWDRRGKLLAREHEALRTAASAVRRGCILALKGIGGFQLVVDARLPEAVTRLRRRKHRQEKPLALMYPDLQTVDRDCRVSSLEKDLLQSVQAPIVLLQRRTDGGLFPDPHRCVLAPRNPWLGIMLPYSPLHHLLLHELGFPIVATSGNLSEEPICIDEREALRRLHDIADLFLVHDRPIQRHVDDSVVCVVQNQVVVLRRARGYAPLPLRVPGLRARYPLAATGAHLKNTVGIAHGEDFFLSPHVGDLSTEAALQAHRSVLDDLRRIYRADPRAVACDLHPDYASTATARDTHRPLVPVQHHHAHIAAVLAEHRLQGPLLGVAWDGAGLGPDGNIWGGEFLVAGADSFTRFAHLRPFPLPGGESASWEPRRSAFGVLSALRTESRYPASAAHTLLAVSGKEKSAWTTMIRNGMNAPRTTSIGRLFDAVASLTGLRQYATYEGQAAMELEFCVPASQPLPSGTVPRYRFRLKREPPTQALTADWEPVVLAILHDLAERVPLSVIATAFHAALCHLVLGVARKAALQDVVLCGGCFQNRVLLKWVPALLRKHGYRVWLPSEVPPNDGAVAFGQLVVAAARTAGTKPEAVKTDRRMTAHVPRSAGQDHQYKGK